MRLHLLILVAALTSQSDALAQSAPERPSETQQQLLQQVPTPPQEDLYLDAMQAIDEGRRDDAGKMLTQLIGKGPVHAGEWLDLALLHCALGHAADAEDLFQEIERRFAPPAGILEIISQQRIQGCASWQPHSQKSLMVGRGHDRNVNQGASNPLFSIGGSEPLELLPEYLPQADSYSVFSADYTRDLSQNGDYGFVQLAVRQNDHLSAYNTISGYVGAEHPWRWGRWRMSGNVLLGALTLGGFLYQEQSQVQLRVNPPLPLPAGWDVGFLGGFSHMNYKTLSNFDSNTAELRTTLSYSGEQRRAQYSIAYLDDHAVGDRPGGDRHGWASDLYARGVLYDKLEAVVDWTRQTWQGQSAYSPGLIDDVRHQNTTVVRTTLSYPVSKRSSLELEWRYVRNQENISLFEYGNHQIQLNWRWRDSK